MKFIEEIVVEEFLPTLRSMLADALRHRGLTQVEVAETLGISQSAVSKYAHGNVSGHEPYASDPRVHALIDRIADGLTAGELSPEHALVEIEVFIRQLEHGDTLAKRHEHHMPGLTGVDRTFSIHDPENRLLATERVLTSIRRGLRHLKDTPGFVHLIPNVGSNLVQALPAATTIDDVAGIPGRLFPVNDTLIIPADPEFGASGHVASVLLAIIDANSPARAAINIRYDPAIITLLEQAGYSPVAFDPTDSDIHHAITDSVSETTDVLYQTGAFGVEPIIYLLAATAPDAARIASDLTDGP